MQIVICTAYSDHSWAEITEELEQTDRLLILKKPFDSIEVSQLAAALTEKWNLARQARVTSSEMEQIIQQRTSALTETNENLRREIAQHKQTLKELQEMRQQLA